MAERQQALAELRVRFGRWCDRVTQAGTDLDRRWILTEANHIAKGIKAVARPDPVQPAEPSQLPTATPVGLIEVDQADKDAEDAAADDDDE